MRKAYVNCHIDKSDDTAFLVEEETIIKTGSTEAIREDMSESDEEIDLNGMTVMPGFVDSHMHVLELGYYLSNLVLSEADSISKLQEMIRKKIPEVKDDEWLTGRGFHEDRFVEKRMITKNDLDAVTTDIPIALTRACGHIMVLNTKALDLLHIQEDVEMEGGYVTFSSGLVEENGVYYVHARMPEPDEKKIEAYLKKGIACANSYGVTTIGSDDFLAITKDYKNVLNVMEKMAYQQKLNIRINEQCEFNDLKEFAGFLDDGYTFDVGNDFFRIGPLKLILDGSLGAATAAVQKNYPGEAANRGTLCMRDEDVEMFVKLANRFNMPTIAHAIGDRALDQILNVFDDAVLPGNPLHHGIVHCQLMRQDQIETVLRKQLVCYFQSLFIDSDASQLIKKVDPQLAKTSYPYKTLCEGTIAANGSDAPVELPDVMKGIQLALTRTSTIDGTRMNAAECLSIDEAIASYTENGARAFFMDDRIGKIAVGYYADFVVLEHDIRKMNPEDIGKTKVMMTVVNGRTVFER